MNASTFAARYALLIGLSVGAHCASAADVVLQTTTGATVACADLAHLHDVDMQRRFGIANFQQAHAAYVRLRTYGPSDCRRGETLAAQAGSPVSASRMKTTGRLAVRGEGHR